MKCIGLIVLFGLVAANAQIVLPSAYLNSLYSPLAYRGWGGPAMVTSAALLKSSPYHVRYAYNMPYAYNGLRAVYPALAKAYSPLVLNPAAKAVYSPYHGFTLLKAIVPEQAKKE